MQASPWTTGIARPCLAFCAAILAVAMTAVPAQADVNLVPSGRSGWYAPVVPKGMAIASATECLLDPYRIGIAQFYWNAHGENDGGDPTPGGFDVSFYLDGAFSGLAYAGATAGEWYVVNQGPVSADLCGVHTVSCYVDALHSIAETDETDNIWGGQYVWDFIPIWADGAAVTHVAPPDRTGGWEHIVDASPRENCDGYLFRSDVLEWQAVTVAALDGADNYDARLYEFDDNDPTGGFHTLRASSDRAAGRLDVLLLNCAYATFGNFYNVAVVNPDGGAGDYRITRRAGYELPFDTPTAFSLDADDNLDIWGVSLEAGQQGPVTAVLETSPDSGLRLVRLEARDPGWSFWAGDLADAAASAAVAADGIATLSWTVGDDREQALLVYRDPAAGQGAVSGTVRLVAATAELGFQTAAWWSPLVPSDTDQTGNPVVLPASLPGDVAGTYHNWLMRNDGIVAAGTFTNRLFVDGVLAHDVLYLGGVPAATTQAYWQQYAETVRGGRHTVSLRLDIHGTVPEVREDDNVYGEQYCWTPLELTYGVPVERAWPPDPAGGHDHVPAGTTLYANCDGVRLPYRNIVVIKNGGWRGVAAMPGPDSAVDLILHDASTGPKDGFAAWRHYSSNQVEGRLEYVAVNFRQTANVDYDVGIRRRSGVAAGVGVEAVSSAWLGTAAGSPYGPFDLAPGHALDLYELVLDAGVCSFEVDNLSGAGRLGLTLHRADLPYVAMGTEIVGIDIANGDGERAYLILDVPAPGNYGLAIFKSRASDFDLDLDYRLHVLPGVVGVGETPAVSATVLRDARPNPFNPRTVLTCDVRIAGRVVVGIYDVQGRLVRTLLDEVCAAGRREITWDGADDAGRSLASGIYLARLRAADADSHLRLTLVR